MYCLHVIVNLYAHLFVHMCICLRVPVHLYAVHRVLLDIRTHVCLLGPFELENYT